MSARPKDPVPDALRTVRALRAVVPHLGERALSTADVSALMARAGLSWADEPSGTAGAPLVVAKPDRSGCLIYLPAEVPRTDPPTPALVYVAVARTVIYMQPQPVRAVVEQRRTFSRAMRHAGAGSDEDAQHRRRVRALMREMHRHGYSSLLADIAAVVAVLPLETAGDAARQGEIVRSLRGLHLFHHSPVETLKHADQVLVNLRDAGEAERAGVVLAPVQPRVTRDRAEVWLHARNPFHQRGYFDSLPADAAQRERRAMISAADDWYSAVVPVLAFGFVEGPVGEGGAYQHHHANVPDGVAWVINGIRNRFGDLAAVLLRHPAEDEDENRPDDLLYEIGLRLRALSSYTEPAVPRSLARAVREALTFPAERCEEALQALDQALGLFDEPDTAATAPSGPARPARPSGTLTPLLNAFDNHLAPLLLLASLAQEAHGNVVPAAMPMNPDLASAILQLGRDWSDLWNEIDAFADSGDTETEVL